MLIAWPDTSIKTKFNYPLIKQDGTLLSTSYYSITPMIEEECTWVDKMTLQIEVGEDLESPYVMIYEAGDNIILSIDGKIQFNRVEEIDPTNYRIKCSKIISLTAPTTFTIKGDYNIYTIESDCSEDYYRMKNNELFIIKSSFMSLYIDFSSLITRNKRVIGLFKECDMKMYNQEGLNSIYADLAYHRTVWSLIDAGQLRELLMLKILAIVESNHYPTETSSRTDYSNFLKSTLNWLKLESDGKSTDVEQSATSTFSFRLGS